MANLRNDPFRNLFNLQDQLFRTFDEAYRRGPTTTSGENPDQSLGSAWTPLVDVFEDADGITLKVELPEVDPNDVDIRVEGNTLQLRGERKLENEQEREGYHRIERAYGSFSRTFTLPSTIDAEHISAESKAGVLRLRLPKKAETRPRQIKVQVDSNRLTSGSVPPAKQ